MRTPLFFRKTWLALVSAFLISGCNYQTSLSAQNGSSTQTAIIKPSPSPTTPAPVPPTGTQAQSADAFVDTMGVNTHIHYADTVYGSLFSKIATELGSLGMRHLRDGGGMEWDDAFRQPIYSRMKSLYTSYGIRYSLVITPINPNDSPSYVTPDVTAITGYQNTTVYGYLGAAIENIEGPNEMGNNPWLNTLWSPDYVDYIPALYRTVKADANLKNLPIFGGALADSSQVPTLAQAAQSRGVNLSNSVDYGNMHSYTSPDSNDIVNTLQANLAVYPSITGSKPLVITETGYHNAIVNTSCGNTWWNGISELASAKYNSRIYLEDFNAGIKRTFLYEFIDEHADPNCGESNFGLLRNDGSEKPSYVMLKNLITLLKDPGATFNPASLSYSLSGGGSSIHKTLLAKRDGRIYLVLWQDVQVYDTSQKKDSVNPPVSVTLTLGRAFSRANYYTPLSSASPFSSTDSPTSVTLSISDHPLVVELVP